MSARITIRIPEWVDRICVWPWLIYRLWKYGYTYRRIYLGEGEWTIVEPGDYYWLNKYNWCLLDKGQQKYARRILYDPKAGITSVSMHREIMKPPKYKLIDHRNGNGLDNRRDNLRPATRSENMYNRRKTKSKTTSSFIGIYFDGKKWRASIKYSGKKLCLGSYINEIDAAKAYDAAARKHHREFARLNFPETP
jgi:hypothetical protein